MNVNSGAMLCGRRLEFFTTVSDSAWGYKEEQKDTFAIHYPRDYDDTKAYPLYVVFHSAGHDIYSTLNCILFEGNHDIYHTPDDMFGLILDCRANADNDWWWGGVNIHDEVVIRKTGIRKTPVEHRCIATVEWVMENYPIDRDRVYAVGNSMGGNGALGICLCRGDIFAAIKVNVAAGVRFAADRCCLDTDAPEGFAIPDPPVVVDYSAQDDIWSADHDVLYRCMREKRYALHGYWGEFGHENNHSIIAKHNDLVHAVPVLELKKSEAYPVFTGADSDDKNPWEHPDDHPKAGQVNGFFRWENVSDTEDTFEMKLRLLTGEDWETRVALPERVTADLLLRRVQKFTLAPGEKFSWTLTAESGKTVSGSSVADGAGHPVIDGIAVTKEPQVLVITRGIS